MIWWSYLFWSDFVMVLYPTPSEIKVIIIILEVDGPEPDRFQSIELEPQEVFALAPTNRS